VERPPHGCGCSVMLLAMADLTPTVHAVLAEQDGVVNRRQLLAAGVPASGVRSLLRCRRLAPVHPGVYVDHTGPLTTRQRWWAAVLYAAPAGLRGRSVLAFHGLRSGAAGTVCVVVRDGRELDPPDGVVVHRSRRFAELLDRSPGVPRTTLEEAVLDVASEASSDGDAVAVLAEAVSSRRTTAARLADCLALRGRIARRDLLGAVLADVAAGACSVLERAYLRDVERAHGLPTAQRQVRASSRGTVFRDVDYEELALIVELDGRMDHSHVADKDRDLDRDLDAAVDGTVTVRLGHGQVVGRTCVTADRLGRLMRARGWSGTVQRCAHCP